MSPLSTPLRVVLTYTWLFNVQEIPTSNQQPVLIELGNGSLYQGPKPDSILDNSLMHVSFFGATPCLSSLWLKGRLLWKKIGGQKLKDVTHIGLVNAMGQVWAALISYWITLWLATLESAGCVSLPGRSLTHWTTRLSHPAAPHWLLWAKHHCYTLTLPYFSQYRRLF